MGRPGTVLSYQEVAATFEHEGTLSRYTARGGKRPRIESHVGVLPNLSIESSRLNRRIERESRNSILSLERRRSGLPVSVAREQAEDPYMRAAAVPNHSDF